MKCPHCTVSIHAAWNAKSIVYHTAATPFSYRSMVCPACSKWVIELKHDQGDWNLVEPPAMARGPIPPEVPKTIAVDYLEACKVLPVSPKASAALSRRCLQSMLRAHGYSAKDLAKEIDLLLAETDASKAIPPSLRTVVDAIRNFGNFSAHPITDVTSLQIIDVEPEEAEWCLEVLEECFDFFYVRPAQAAKRKAELDAKLASAGKPQSKG
ncbi:conserved hypothetical protein [Mesorhizobium plurifarium]|uniref:DUF4145 domain-containing protein n=1 Tax=Mesorhizobium plurifarium TaxID=69974 RepID=A0A090EAJ3_MESPL|nr:conserved hypothetical protein [Mesorhizobium plurifarium]